MLTSRCFMGFQRKLLIRRSDEIGIDFPSDFVFQLSRTEYDAMRSQIVTGSLPSKPMRSQIVTASRRNISALPYAFTEQGVAMLSKRASQHTLCRSKYRDHAYVCSTSSPDGFNGDLARKIEDWKRNTTSNSQLCSSDQTVGEPARAFRRKSGSDSFED